MSKDKRDLVVIVVGRILQIVFALLSVRLTTTLLGPVQIGRINLLLGVTSWFGLLLISPVGNYVFRQTLEWNIEGKLNSSLRRYIIFLVGIAIFAVSLLTIVYYTIGIGTQIQLPWLLFLVLSSLTFGVLSATYVTIINILGYRIWYVLFSNLVGWLGLGVAISLVLWFEVGAEYWLTGLMVGQIIVMIGAGTILYKVANKTSVLKSPTVSVNKFDIRSIFSFSWPLIIATAFYWFQNSGYRFLLVWLTNESTVGLFATGAAIAVSPMVMFETMFTEYYRPIFYRDIVYSDNQQQAQAWNQYASAYFPAIILVTAYLAVSGPFLAQLLVSHTFQQVSWLAFWGAVTQAMLMIYATYSSLVFASLDTRVMIRSNILGAFVALVSLFILGSWQPLLGTGVALLLGMSVLTLDLARRLRKKFLLRLPWSRIFTAGIISLPLLLALEAAKSLWPNPSVLQSLVILGVGGLYVLIGQLILARRWLFRPNSSLIASQAVTPLPQ